MIVHLLIELIMTAFNVLFFWLPTVESLPTIIGYDIDTNMVDGMNTFYAFTDAVWPVQIVMQGLLFLIGYYSIKMVLKFFLGSRTPGANL